MNDLNLLIQHKLQSQVSVPTGIPYLLSTRIFHLLMSFGLTLINSIDRHGFFQNRTYYRGSRPRLKSRTDAPPIHYLSVLIDCLSNKVRVSNLLRLLVITFAQCDTVEPYSIFCTYLRDFTEAAVSRHRLYFYGGTVRS